jgi:uncharacterized protein (TIGR02145 family)
MVLAIVLSTAAGLTSCKKLEPTRKIIVKTTQVSEVTHNSCVISGSVYDTGLGSISDYGFKISHTKDNSGIYLVYSYGPLDEPGDFMGDAYDLVPSTIYFATIFAKSGEHETTGDWLEFTTLDINTPQVETGQVIFLSPVRVDIECNVISGGESPITEMGICWDIQSDPTIDDSKTSNIPTGTGVYEGVCDNLIPDNTYYARAYAINEAGIAYGENREFRTTPPANLPQVTTNSVQGIGETIVTCGGTITSDGGAPILAKGLCWSDETNDPNLEEHESYYSGEGDGFFEEEITGLTHYTEYYIRAYAINYKGTSYGEPVRFRTRLTAGEDLLDPRDGQLYPTVLIGEQCWMAKNLNVGNWVEITDGQMENETIEKYCYEDNPGNCDQYGGLYTWAEMMQYSLEESTQGICPEGFHIPSDNEWKELESTLGILATDLDLTDFRGTNQGGQLKTPDTPPWIVPNTLANNSTGFSALPTGMIYEAVTPNSQGFGYYTVFWTSTFYLDDTNAYYRMLQHDQGGIKRSMGYAANTTPVRCVRD